MARPAIYFIQTNLITYKNASTLQPSKPLRAAALGIVPECVLEAHTTAILEGSASVRKGGLYLQVFLAKTLCRLVVHGTLAVWNNCTEPSALTGF